MPQRQFFKRYFAHVDALTILRRGATMPNTRLWHLVYRCHDNNSVISLPGHAVSYVSQRVHYILHNSLRQRAYYILLRFFRSHVDLFAVRDDESAATRWV